MRIVETRVPSAKRATAKAQSDPLCQIRKVKSRKIEPHTNRRAGHRSPDTPINIITWLLSATGSPSDCPGLIPSSAAWISRSHCGSSPRFHAALPHIVGILDSKTASCACAARAIPPRSCSLTQTALRLMLTLPALLELLREVAVAGTSLLSRQMFRRGLLCFTLYPLPSRMHRLRCGVRVPRPCASGRRALRRSEFTGDENAIVDFKYSASPRITWWFDHHLSAFLTPQDHEHFLACQRDPAAPRASSSIPTTPPAPAFWPISHPRILASTPRRSPTSFKWADIVDGALYESPESAVEMAAPAMKLTLIIESTQDPAFIPRLIPLLTEMPLAEVLAQPFVAPCCRRFSSATRRPSS